MLHLSRRMVCCRADRSYWESGRGERGDTANYSERWDVTCRSSGCLRYQRTLTAPASFQLFAIVPMGQGAMSSQLGSMLAGPSVVPEAQMLGAGPEMFNCMGCTCPSRAFPAPAGACAFAAQSNAEPAA